MPFSAILIKQKPAMSTNKKMFDKGLRSKYWSLKLLANIVTTKLGIKLLDKIGKLAKGKDIRGLYCAERYIPSKNDGPDIRVRIYRPKNASGSLPGILYNHGGGYMLDIPENYASIIEKYIITRPCVVVAPDYRRSPDEPYPAGFNDCYDTLLWMKEHGESLGIKPKIIVAGHSAGGGLAAAVTLKARDTQDVDIAFQMPIYPMIDHRQNTDSAKKMDDVPVWHTKANAVGWKLYLKNIQYDEVPAYASPALNTDYTNFPPTITFVGDLEPFKDETINYVQALKAHNIPVRFELFKGAFHAFESIEPKAAIAQKANKFQIGAFAEYYDRYA
jgi:acetyl esterase/lipase